MYTIYKTLYVRSNVVSRKFTLQPSDDKVGNSRVTAGIPQRCWHKVCKCMHACEHAEQHRNAMLSTCLQHATVQTVCHIDLLRHSTSGATKLQRRMQLSCVTHHLFAHHSGTDCTTVHQCRDVHRYSRRDVVRCQHAVGSAPHVSRQQTSVRSSEHYSNVVSIMSLCNMTLSMTHYRGSDLAKSTPHDDTRHDAHALHSDALMHPVVVNHHRTTTVVNSVRLTHCLYARFTTQHVNDCCDAHNVRSTS